MKFFEQNNNIMIGILLGATIPIIGYLCIESVFELMTSQGLMDEVSSASELKRTRTMALIAICTNIIGVQIFKGRRYGQLLNGIIIATFIYAGFWILLFKTNLIL
jgi:hypothetical protein